MTEFTKADAADLMRRKALTHHPEGIKIVSGTSHWYIDVKRGVGHGSDLRNIGGLIIRVAHNELGLDFNAVGGPTMGADPFSYTVMLLSGDEEYGEPFDCRAFSIRKEVDEERAAQTTPPVSPPRFAPGTPEEYFWIEGYAPREGDRVLWVEDAISTGQSVLTAMEHFNEHPTAKDATIVGAMAVVDRGDLATQVFADLGIPYTALVTYHDLGIPPVGQG